MPAAPPDIVDALLELARQVRQTTLQLVEGTDDRWLTWSPPGTANHILWHAGHALWVVDALTVRPLTGHSELPQGWAAVFGQNSQPAAISEWPDAGELRSHLHTQLRRIVELLSQHADTIRTKPNETPPGGGWPLLPGMIHGWHDEARHQGEMYLLHKIARAQ